MRRMLVIVVASLLCGLVPGSAGAITGGQKDTQNQYPFVGLLAFYDDEGEYMHRCSGTLISPTVVLTAAHCTEGTATAYAYFQVEVADDFRENPTGLLGTTYTHPDYNSNTLDNDVGVVVLEQAVNLSEYPVLAPEGFLSELKAEHEIQDDTFVNVGYGLLDGWPPPEPPGQRGPLVLHVPVSGADAEQPAPAAKPRSDRRGRDVLRRFGWSALLGGHVDHRVRDELG
jgi:Trypsin